MVGIPTTQDGAQPMRDLKSVLAEKGQVTIPKSLRDSLGLKPGTVLRFTLERARIVITKDVSTDPLEAVRGCLPYQGEVDRLIDDLRGPA
jgi:antitoxin PrlF